MTPVNLCAVHKEDWTQGEYLKNSDGSIVCPLCGWGTPLPGYMRLHEGRIVDLRATGEVFSKT